MGVPTRTEIWEARRRLGVEVSMESGKSWVNGVEFRHYSVWRCPVCGAGDFDTSTPLGAYIVDCPECDAHVICGPRRIWNVGNALVVAGEKKR